mmetsp:Transcript_20441/g.40882  ORF Transcript_20441/g.40882 Transcript_20441/m.40882 type:complete len:90 (-) Transcript_20441:421-690(-)
MLTRFLRLAYSFIVIIFILTMIFAMFLPILGRIYNPCIFCTWLKYQFLTYAGYLRLAILYRSGSFNLRGGAEDPAAPGRRGDVAVSHDD